MKNRVKILSITCLSLIQSYSFANGSTNDKVADEYIYITKMASLQYVIMIARLEKGHVLMKMVLSIARI
ncbi:hypothetical protein BBD39_07500 [Arsenophonus endosymbiont of Bemisia tabaci Asia II 3]|nr:hypothetical protein BBD39_07500 [Arsenophonus endosymbiont of Bemisia tabaci Asia II 3]